MVGPLVPRLKSPISIRLDDVSAEQVRRNHDDRISELQGLPFAQAKLIQNVSLPNATNVPIAHGLGRKPSLILVSPPRDNTTAGSISETRASNLERDSLVILQANGFGATITVDVVVL